MTTKRDVEGSEGKTASKATEFFCPLTREPLSVSLDASFLETLAGRRYRIIDGIPELLLEAGHQDAGSHSQEYYRARADEYDRGMDAILRTLVTDEAPARNDMLDMLGIAPGARVLEVGCGTGRDTKELLARGASVYASDLSYEMIFVGRHRLERLEADLSRLRLLLAEATRLPFADHFFDAAFHFGGLNLFPDIGAALTEMTRVVKPGGRVVAGDEGVGPWLADTDFSKILKNSNPLFDHRMPLERLPVSARDVTCRWIFNGAFYVIGYTVGDGPPQLDLDIEFPGWRGGTHRTRYFGKLEGVAPELRDRIVKAAASEGVSIAAWLERTLGRALDSTS